MEEKICPHIDCLVYHDGKPCTCNMARWCSKCGGEFASPEGKCYHCENCKLGFDDCKCPHPPYNYELNPRKCDCKNKSKESWEIQTKKSLESFDKILSIIQDGRDKGFEAETILQSIESELMGRKV